MSSLSKITVTKEKKFLAQLQEAVDSFATIETEADAFRAADLLLQARQFINDTDEKMNEYAKPMKALLDKLKDEFGEVLVPMKAIEDSLKTSVTTYIVKHNEQAEQKLQEMRVQVGDPTLQLDLYLDKLTTQHGEVRFRNDIKILIADESKIPKKFLKTVVDVKAIEAALKENDKLVIPGVEISKTKSPALYVSK